MSDSERGMSFEALELYEAPELYELGTAEELILGNEGTKADGNGYGYYMVC